MTTDKLREQYPGGQGAKCITHEDVGNDYFTDDYVLWLEERIISDTNISKLVEALREDQSNGSYYHSWKSNIAMAIKDTWDSEVTTGLRDSNIMSFCNSAAERFLKLLML